MKNKKRWFWLGLALVCGCSIVLFFLFLTGSWLFRKNSSITHSSVPAESLSLTAFEPIQGTSIFIATIEQEKKWSPDISARWFSFDYGYTVRNLVFLDGNTLLSHYLFDTNENYVVDIAQFPTPSSYGDTEPIEVKWLVYEIAQKDTNSDGLLNANDKFSVALSNADGQQYSELVKNVSAIYGMDLLENHFLLLVYEADGESWASKIDLEQKTILETQKLAVIPSEKAP